MGDEFPFTLPMLKRGGPNITFEKPITIFAGENSTGKSSLIEAIARGAGYNVKGGSRDNLFNRADGEGGLAEALRFTWNLKVPGFFFRAETFFDFITYLERAYRQDHKLPPWGERSLHNFSHGEAFFIFFECRLGTKDKCLYLLDEPEAALAPDRQLEFLAMIQRQCRTGRVQYIVATHSPLLMACPDAEMVHFTYRGLKPAAFRETSHFRRYAAFFHDPETYVAEEIQRIEKERREIEEEDAVRDAD